MFALVDSTLLPTICMLQIAKTCDITRFIVNSGPPPPKIPRLSLSAGIAPRLTNVEHSSVRVSYILPHIFLMV